LDAKKESAMRFRVYGLDSLSGEAREPLEVEADTEEAARQQAMDTGIQVRQVEAVGPMLDLESMHPPANGRFNHRTRRTPRLVVLVLLPVAVAAGIGIGLLIPRGERAPTGASTQTAPAGIHVEELQSAEDMFALAGQKAVVFKFTGGDVSFRVEIERDGKKWSSDLAFPPAAEPDKPPEPGQRVEGYFVWARGGANDVGMEPWRVALRRDLVTTESSSTNVPKAGVPATVTQSHEKRQSSSTSLETMVQVWRPRIPAARLPLHAAAAVALPVPSGSVIPVAQFVALKRFHDLQARDKGAIGAGTSSRMIGSIPNPLPADEEVCLKEIQEEVVGGDPDNDRHRIRVLCKVLPRKDQAPAK
jgi:hypothetical protein